MSSRETELAWLIDKINRSESLVIRAEAYYQDRNHLWTPGVAGYFQDMIERKKDQIHYEKHRAEKLGWVIAAEQLRKG